MERVGLDHEARLAELVDFFPKPIVERDGRPEPQAAVGKPSDRHARRKTKAQKEDRRSFGDPEIVTDAVEHAHARDSTLSSRRVWRRTFACRACSTRCRSSRWGGNSRWC